MEDKSKVVWDTLRSLHAQRALIKQCRIYNVLISYMYLCQRDYLKQEAHGTHLLLTLETINSFAQNSDYAITLREKNHYLHFKN